MVLRYLLSISLISVILLKQDTAAPMLRSSVRLDGSGYTRCANSTKQSCTSLGMITKVVASFASALVFLPPLNGRPSCSASLSNSAVES